MSSMNNNLNFMELLLLFLSFSLFIILKGFIFFYSVFMFSISLMLLKIFMSEVELYMLFLSFKVLYFLLSFFIFFNILLNINFFMFFSLVLLLSFILLFINFLYLSVGKINNEIYSIFLNPVYFFMLLYLILMLGFCILDLLSYLLFSFLGAYSSLEEVFVIFYFLKYNFVWLTKILWFSMAMSGLVMVYMGLFMMLLGENDPYFIKSGDQLVYWYFTEGDLDLVLLKEYLLSNFNLISDSFTVSSYFFYDTQVLMKYSAAVSVFLFFKFLLLSFISVWLYEMFWYYFYEVSCFPSKLFWFMFVYVFLFMMFLNLMLAFLYMSFLGYVMALAVEAKFIEDFVSPSGYMSSPMQEESFESQLYSMVTKEGSSIFKCFYLSKYYLLMLPQSLGIKLASSVLVYCNYSKLNNKINKDYNFLLSDLYMFLDSVNLLHIFKDISVVLKLMDLMVKNPILVKMEFLLIIKMSLIPINIYNQSIIKLLLKSVCNMESIYLLSQGETDLYPDYFLNKDFMLESYYKSFKVNSVNFLCSIMIDSPLIIFKGYYFNFYMFEVYFKDYFLNSSELFIKKLMTLNNLYGFYNYIMKDMKSSLTISKTYVSNGLGMGVKMSFVTTTILPMSDYKFLKSVLTLNSKSLEFWDIFPLEEKMNNISLSIYIC